MTNLPSREELEQAIYNHSNAIGDDIEVAWDALSAILDNLYSAVLEPLTLEKARLISHAADVGGVLTINDVRTKVLGWPPLPPDDHRGNSLLRRDP